jgi:hypothetical protein
VLIAEELLILALDPRRGTPVNSSRSTLAPGLCGALVAELGLLDVLEVVGKRFAPLGPPPADPLLGEVHQLLSTSNGRTSASQLRKLDRALGGSWAKIIDRLLEGKVVARQRDRILGIVPVTRHPVLRHDLSAEVVTRLQAAAAGTGPLEPRTAVVLALAGPCRLLEVVAPDRGSRSHAKRRIAEATSVTPVAPVVKRVIQEAQSAAAAAAAVSGAAVAAGG